MYGTDRVAPAAADLANRKPFALGTTTIIPATREISGPDGTGIVPPRVMQVLLALADAEGAVITRDALAQRCWSGRFVAEDSLNGAIAELRKALRAASVQGVGIETVPKTGYRLTGADFMEASPAIATAAFGFPAPTRRVVLVGSIAAIAGAGFAGWIALNRDSRQATLLIERGTQALRQGLPDANAQGVQFFDKAVALEPGNAKGWGMLALAWRAAAEYGAPGNTATARANSEMAAKRALAINSRQSDALTALAILTPSFGDWAAAERRIRNVLAVDPGNYFAVAALGTLMMSTGQVRASLKCLNWLAEQDPLSANVQFRRVYTLWSVDRLAEMDRTADRALQSWPRHPAVWFARFWTLAFTGRAAAAQAMLSDATIRPQMPIPAVELLQLSVKAIGSNRTPDIMSAVAANLEAASRGPGQATTAIMVLSQLGASAAAYDVARGLLAQLGPVIVRQRHTSAQASITDQHHRMTMMLWIPATRTLRLHPGFRSLCDGMGMLDYWKTTNNRPDFNIASLATP